MVERVKKGRVSKFAQQCYFTGCVQCTHGYQRRISLRDTFTYLFIVEQSNTIGENLEDVS